MLLVISNFAYAASSQDKPISQYSNRELIEVFGKLLNEKVDFEQEKASKIQNELIKRRAVKETVELFQHKDNAIWTLGWCYQIFVKLRSPETDKLLKPLADKNRKEQSYFANKYFAETGKKFALENLNASYFNYPVSSLEWSEIVDLFGKYKYFSATKNIISTINAASLNLAGASVEALESMYPETKEGVERIEKSHGGIDKEMTEIINYYSTYIKDHRGDNK